MCYKIMGMHVHHPTGQMCDDVTTNLWQAAASKFSLYFAKHSRHLKGSHRRAPWQKLILFFVGWVLFLYAWVLPFSPPLPKDYIDYKQSSKKKGNQLTKGTRCCAAEGHLWPRDLRAQQQHKKKTQPKEGRTILRRRDTRAVHETRGIPHGGGRQGELF